MSATSRVTQTPALSRSVAATLAATENARFVAFVSSLAAEDWARRTDCPDWDVRAMTAHVLGAMQGHVKLRVMAHQLRAGRT